MQSASARLTAAITAQERPPSRQVLVDWDNDGSFAQANDDQSAFVESITIDRTLTTDLPDAVDLLAGYSSAEATITLAGSTTDETKTAAWYYSSWSTGSPIYGKRRRWRTVNINLGFAGETIPAFTGKTRDLKTTCTPDGTTVTMTVLDNAETMRGPVTVPLVVADNKATLRPNLNASWVVDYIARKCGYFASPPQRANCKFLATFAGSAFPTVGTMTRVESVSGGLVFPVTFGAGRFIQGTSGDSAVPNLADYALSGTLSTNDGGEVLIEGWVNAPTGAQGLCEVHGGGANYNFVSMVLNSSSQLIVNVRRSVGGAIASYNSGITVPTGQWVYVATHVNFTSTTTTVQWRVNSTSASTSAATASVVGQQSLTFASWSSADDSTGTGLASWNCQFEAWQVSNPGIGTGTPTWNDAYVGNSIVQPSLNALTATVSTRDVAWSIVQEIAAAELATVGFDEAGRFTFYNRNRWTTAPYTTSQRTIDASALKDLAVVEAIDQVRNHVKATASPAAVQAAGWVWKAADIIVVPASGSTTVQATFDNPVMNLSTTVTYASASNPTGGSYYRANRNRDGSGTAVTNLTFTVTTDGATATVVITNTNAFAVYLVTPSGFIDPQGVPSLALWGQSVLYATSPVPDTSTVGVTVPTQTIFEVSDATSIDQHGDQLLEIPVNPWLQDSSSIGVLVADALARLKDPPPVLSGLSIPEDPRLQLGDRITVLAPQLGTAIPDFFLIGIRTTRDANGAGQALTTRAV